MVKFFFPKLLCQIPNLIHEKHYLLPKSIKLFQQLNEDHLTSLSVNYYLACKNCSLTLASPNIEIRYPMIVLNDCEIYYLKSVPSLLHLFHFFFRLEWCNLLSKLFNNWKTLNCSFDWMLFIYKPLNHFLCPTI